MTPDALPSFNPLRELAQDLFVVERPLSVAGIEIGMRMTVIRLANGDLFLHSPVPVDDELRAAINAVGRVRHVVAPNKVHHLFVAGARAAWPDARFYAAPGLPEKRRDFHFDEVLGTEAPEAWRGQIDQVHMGGMPYVEEVVFHHRASGTVLLTDLAFNMREGKTFMTRIFLRVMGVSGRFGPSRMFKQMIRDRAAARASLDAVLAWEFDRVIVTHGVVLASRGKRLLRDAYKWMG
jgi:hypothetical protein